MATYSKLAIGAYLMNRRVWSSLVVSQCFGLGCNGPVYNQQLHLRACYANHDTFV